MQSSPESAQFIAWLVELTNAKKILEVGTFTGYTTLAMALAQSDDGRVMTCDVSRECVAMAEKYWEQAGVRDRIDSRIQSGLLLLDELRKTEENNFDLIFIDADKKPYPDYFEHSFHLLRPGGVIVVDNVLWSGRVLDASDQSEQTKAIRKLNEQLARDARVSVSMIPIGDGVTLVRKH
jgi:predicted O-methyltransferase YrrM